MNVRLVCCAVGLTRPFEQLLHVFARDRPQLVARESTTRGGRFGDVAAGGSSDAHHPSRARVQKASDSTARMPIAISAHRERRRHPKYAPSSGAANGSGSNTFAGPWGNASPVFATPTTIHASVSATNAAAAEIAALTASAGRPESICCAGRSDGRSGPPRGHAQLTATRARRANDGWFELVGAHHSGRARPWPRASA
jgi:hypothetical protein